MSNYILILVGSLGLSSGGLAQQLSPSVVATGGGFARTPTMTLEWTLGESVVETARTPDRLYTQGFHQPSLRVTELPVENTEQAGQFLVAPNPVATYLTVTAKTVQETACQLLLTDMTGHQYQMPDLPSATESVQVDMTRFPAGTYLLHISKPNGLRLKTYKVSKIQ